MTNFIHFVNSIEKMALRAKKQNRIIDTNRLVWFCYHLTDSENRQDEVVVATSHSYDDNGVSIRMSIRDIQEKTTHTVAISAKSYASVARNCFHIVSVSVDNDAYADDDDLVEFGYRGTHVDSEVPVVAF